MTASIAELAERYRRQAGAFDALIAATPPDRWTSQSPCEKWLARDIVAHVVFMHGHAVHRDEPVDATAAGFDPGVAFRAARVEIERVLGDPATTPDEAAHIDADLTTDIVQHLWDLASATGQAVAIDADEVESLWAVLSVQSPEWWEFMRTPGKFGPGIEVYGAEVPVPRDAPLLDRLLGLLGRDPGWAAS